MLRGHGDLKTILSSVTTSCDSTTGDSIKSGWSTSHECHLHQVKVRREQFCDSGGSAWSLDSKELHRFLQIFHGDISIKGSHLFLKVLHITKFRRTIHDHVNVVPSVGNDGVVNDPTLLVGDQTQQTTAIGKSSNVSNNNLLQKCNSILSMPANLSHVRHVEQRSLSFTSTPQVLLHNTSIFPLVQNRKLIASERHHVASELLVQLIQSCFHKRFIGSGSKAAPGRAVDATAGHAASKRRCCNCCHLKS
mmetsp:Transcript_2885/g.4958  ORF Transcript_2885/g.4958 Transcript_2885/m.4958 type:complete len:249 (+) Transcript_2885:611-1357(+)